MLKILIPTIALLLIPSWHHSIHTLMFLSLILILYFSPMNIPTSLTESLTLDNMSIPLLILSTWITMLMLIASYPIKTMKKLPHTFLITCLALLFFLILSFSVNNLLMFYIAFEASLIPTLFLILTWGYQPERLQAGLYSMMYTITASLPLLMGIASIAHQFNSLNMFSLHPTCFLSNPSNLISLVMMAAFMVKMPMYGVHLWLPKAHVEAPVAGSMVLAGVLLKLGSYGLLRMSNIIMSINAAMSNSIMAICMVGGVMTGLTCIRQPDLKALIAYSSVAHMALLTAGAMSNSLWGWEGALAMMLAHGLCSSALFAIANSTYETTQTRSLFLTKGMLSLFPAMTLWWFVLLAANLGAPPSLNLLSEIMLLTSILSISTSLAIPIALTSFMAATYSLILFTSTQHGSLPSFTNPLTMYSYTRTHILMMLHAIPLFLLIMKTSLICLWL
uniref:NADH-ubiquinone oxidoreductase chain 4 n=1 Tax=Orbinia latreillii TaxID=195264 RepID=Q1X8Y3_9ANNE|nr:NADH dehydrogenase subunit 4 [Orbinia latreillii]AAX50148.1 NADH dehydrogenase subunit 4 [Orbinia latreillii]